MWIQYLKVCNMAYDIRYVFTALKASICLVLFYTSEKLADFDPKQKVHEINRISVVKMKLDGLFIQDGVHNYWVQSCDHQVVVIDSPLFESKFRLLFILF